MGKPRAAAVHAKPLYKERLTHVFKKRRSTIRKPVARVTTLYRRENGISYMCTRTSWLGKKIHRVDGPAQEEWCLNVHDLPILMNQSWKQNGIYHRTDGAALIVYREDDDGNAIPNIERWYSAGVIHRVGAAALTVRAEDGTAVIERWMQNGHSYREDGPTDQEWGTGPHGRFICEQRWKRYGLNHRTDGPAVITYRQDQHGNSYPEHERWFHMGQVHCVGQPAEVVKSADGTVMFERWMELGKFHRSDGPAEVNYVMQNGVWQMASWYWFHRGKQHRDGFEPAAYVHGIFSWMKRGERVSHCALVSASHKIAHFMKLVQARIKCRKRHTVKGLEAGGCVVFPGLEGLVSGFM
jgi:hypothetical protein